METMQSTPGSGELMVLNSFVSKIGIHLNRVNIDM